jgi:hypothetical protein
VVCSYEGGRDSCESTAWTVQLKSHTFNSIGNSNYSTETCDGLSQVALLVLVLSVAAIGAQASPGTTVTWEQVNAAESMNNFVAEVQVLCRFETFCEMAPLEPLTLQRELSSAGCQVQAETPGLIDNNDPPLADLDDGDLPATAPEFVADTSASDK